MSSATTDWDPLRGMTCVCPPGCTTGDTWGDGARFCAPECEPCHLMAGLPYSPPNGSSTAKTANCVQCGNQFPAGRSDARFCSPRCRQRHHRQAVAT